MVAPLFALSNDCSRVLFAFLTAADAFGFYVVATTSRDGGRFSARLGPHAPTARAEDWQGCGMRRAIYETVMTGGAVDAAIAWATFCHPLLGDADPKKYWAVCRPQFIPPDEVGCVGRQHRCFDSLPLERALRGACKIGDAPKALWLVATFGLGPGLQYAGLRYACGAGHIGVVERLALPPPGQLRSLVAGTDYRVFRAACERGHLGVAQWVAARLEPKELRYAVRARNYGAFIGACKGGHGAVARWLSDAAFVDARAGDGAALRYAWARDDRHTVRWLVERFGLAPSEVAACVGWVARYYTRAAVPAASAWAAQYTAATDHGIRLATHPAWGADYAACVTEHPAWGADYAAWVTEHPAWAADYATWLAEHPAGAADYAAWLAEHPAGAADYATWATQVTG